MEKGAFKKHLVGVGHSAKDTGLVLGGMIGGHGIFTAIKKDNWKVNGGLTLVGIILQSFAKKQWVKNLSLGAVAYFGLKTINNLTSDVVNGLEGVPQGVKDILNKYVPKLNGTDDSDVALSAAEQQLLAAYYEKGSRPWNNAIMPGAARNSSMFGLGAVEII